MSVLCRFCALHPGQVFVKTRLTDPETSIQLLKTTVEEVIPGPAEILEPAGLTEARKEYLHKKVGPFVRPACRDLLCPPVED